LAGLAGWRQTVVVSYNRNASVCLIGQHSEVASQAAVQAVVVAITRKAIKGTRLASEGIGLNVEPFGACRNTVIIEQVIVRVTSSAVSRAEA